MFCILECQLVRRLSCNDTVREACLVFPGKSPPASDLVIQGSVVYRLLQWTERAKGAWEKLVSKGGFIRKSDYSLIELVISKKIRLDFL